MENPPKPKPRRTFLFIDESNKTPVPTPRNRLSTVSTNNSGTSDSSSTYCNQMPNVSNELFDIHNSEMPTQKSTSVKHNASLIKFPEINTRISMPLPAQTSDIVNNNGSEDNTVEGHSSVTSYFDRANSNVQPCSGTDTFSIPKMEPKMEPLLACTMNDNQVSLRHPYENWNIFEGPVVPQAPQPMARPSKSTIFEFDPLNSVPAPSMNTNTNTKLLQSFLDNESSAVDNRNEEFDLDPGVSFDDDHFSAPEPPERSDSLELNKTNTKWFLDGSSDDRKSISGDSIKSNNNVSLKKMFSNMLTKRTKEYIKQPSLAELPGVFHSGPLTRIVSSVVEFKNKHLRHCVLKDNKIFCYNDSSCSIIKEEINMELVTSLQISLPLSSR